MQMELEDIINEELNNGEYETSEADGSRNDNNGGTSLQRFFLCALPHIN